MVLDGLNTRELRLPANVELRLPADVELHRVNSSAVKLSLLTGPLQIIIIL